MKAVIHFDGGCSPNPGHKYGSFSIVFDDQFAVEKKRFPLGWGTCNEAEFETLLEALGQLSQMAANAAVEHRSLELSVFTDSTIVRNWLLQYGNFKPERCKNERRIAMGALARRCLDLLDSFQSFSVQWNSREVNVAKFGH